MTSGKTQAEVTGWIIAAVVAAAAAAFFTLDAFIPIQIAVPVLYTIPILLTWLVSGWVITAVVTGCSLVLTVLGISLSPGEFTNAVAADRIMALALQLIIGWLVIHQKRTARQIDAALEALHASEARFRLFFENMAMGAAQISSAGHFSDVNNRLCQITGYAREELVNAMGPLDLVHPDDVETDRERLADFFLAKTPSASFEKRCRHKAGQIVWVRVTVAPIRDDQSLLHATAAMFEDITERVQSEMARLESEARLLLALDSAKMGTWEWMCETDSLRWNDRQFTLFGIRPEDFHGTGTEVLPRIHADDRPRLAAVVRRAVTNGVTVREEFRVVRADGSVRWLFGSGRPVQDEHGCCQQVVGVTLDITERRQAQEMMQRLNESLETRVRERTEALAKANERWNWVVRATNDGVWDWDLLRDTTYFSPRWEEMHGFQQGDESEAREAWSARIHPEDRPRVLDALDRSRADPGFQFCEEYRIHKRGGTYFWVLDRGIVVFDDGGRAIRMVGAETDITWRKEADQALRRREHEFRTLADNVPALFSYVDREQRYRFVNRRYEEFFGRSNKEFIGLPMHDLLGPDGYHEIQPYVEAALRGQPASFEYQLHLPQGQDHWFAAQYVPDRDAQGQVVGLFILITDVTVLKSTEGLLRERERQLRDLGARLMQVQEEERRRISRDLHDDVMQRIGALALQLYGLAASTSSQDEALGSQVNACAVSAEQLTTDLQRMAHQLHPSVLEYVGLETAMRDCVSEFAVRTGISAEFIAQDMPQNISLDQATCLYRVLQEGLQNVQKHAKATTVLVRLLGTGGGVGLCVHDDGRGIENFEGEARRKGLGLTSMEERVRMLNGTFRIRTKPGDGTELHAWVPLEQDGCAS
ncbi:MAG: PAS domain-containing protein [Nitrospira sp.]|nr:PAS domain-containing protein [Nitrospira sp.]MDH5192494.1 PAS domain-containing protein [Nitrospira sp.]